MFLDGKRWLVEDESKEIPLDDEHEKEITELLDLINEHRYDVKVQVNIPHGIYVHEKHQEVINQELNEHIKWCQDYATGTFIVKSIRAHWSYSHYIYYLTFNFNTSRDAVLFKLIYGNTE